MEQMLQSGLKSLSQADNIQSGKSSELPVMLNTCNAFVFRGVPGWKK